jgi:hypothetical protein
MNVSQKEALELTAPPIDILLSLYTYMENKFNSKFHEGMKIRRQLKESV